MQPALRVDTLVRVAATSVWDEPLEVPVEPVNGQLAALPPVVPVAPPVAAVPLVSLLDELPQPTATDPSTATMATAASRPPRLRIPNLVTAPPWSSSESTSRPGARQAPMGQVQPRRCASQARATSPWARWKAR